MKIGVNSIGYFYYKKGNIYKYRIDEFYVNKIAYHTYWVKSENDGEFSFANKNLFNLHFITLSEYRDQQINEILS